MPRFVDMRLTSIHTVGLFVYIAKVSASRLPGVILDYWPSSSEAIVLYSQSIQVLPENVFMDFPNLTVSVYQLSAITTKIYLPVGQPSRPANFLLVGQTL